MLRCEHLSQLAMPELYVELYNNVLFSIVEFMNQQSENKELKIWSISSSHNNVIHIRLEGEELLYTWLVQKGFTVKMSYLHIEIYPSKK